MDDSRSLRIEYVEARRVLLDALDALRPHLDAVVLIGAQAVYLRTTGRLPTYQPYTTDADIVLDPTRLLDIPPLGKSMTEAGFVLTGEPGIWEAHFLRPGFADEILVPVDLIVPERMASKAGRRSARLPGNHGKNTARKSPGVEGTVVDCGPIEIASFEPTDKRSVIINVAGEAALLVAKLHKLGDRLDKPERLQAKDAGDVYRLFDAVDPDRMAARLIKLLADDRSNSTTEVGLAFGDRLFATPSATGVRLAVEALRGIVPEPTVVAVLTTYWESVRSQVSS